MKWLICIFFCVFIRGAGAQEWYIADLIFNAVYSWDEGGIDVKGTALENQPDILYGVHGGWYLSDNFILGYGGYLSNSAFTHRDVSTFNREIKMAYGGLFLQFKKPLNDNMIFESPLFIGSGTAWLNGYQLPPEAITTTAFFILEPGATIALKVLPFMKIEATGTYRLVLGNNLYQTKDSALSRPSIGISVVFFRE